MTRPFHTIGHSNRSLAEFTALLAEAGVERVADIRKLPGSRAHPWFDGDALAPALAGAGIGYERIAELGGLRGRNPGVPPELNGFWTNRSFHNYADYALSDRFRAGLDRLLVLGRAQNCATMCAEAVWWRCHRRIVSDYLIAAGETVINIMGPGRLEEARLTSGAVIRPDGSVVYPA
ncbi:DUF488 family protein [Paracoccus sp. DMF]|uniref:DUF488 domain-containing protein n=1 Tax=Paracoccus sp. DMF TaxID=400837 RepID=UPI001100D2C3|nr:DUF488 domain-containing protein [Paracoccus sp. DMF]MCV2447187.1 DUF488 domain-containing protein [Paracoccus sp. DMF]